MRQRASERCQRRLRPGLGGRGGSRTQTRHDVAPTTKMTKRGHRVVINAFFLDMTPLSTAIWYSIKGLGVSKTLILLLHLKGFALSTTSPWEMFICELINELTKPPGLIPNP